MPHTFTTTRLVEFHHTDAARIMHFGTYFIFMEEAEHAFWRHLGMSVLKADGETLLSWPRVSAKCDYRDSVRFEDVVTISVQIARLGEKSVTYAHRLSHEQRLIAEGSITTVCCRYEPNEDRPTSIAIPTKIRKLLEPYVVGDT